MCEAARLEKCSHQQSYAHYAQPQPTPLTHQTQCAAPPVHSKALVTEGLALCLIWDIGTQPQHQTTLQFAPTHRLVKATVDRCWLVTALLITIA